MTLVKFNNKTFPKSFNSLVDDLFNEWPVVYNNPVHSWKSNVPVNIVETEKNYTVDLVAPGFEKTDFKINLEKDILTISVEKKTEVKEENTKVIRQEYQFRSFKRSFTIDDKVDASAIEAQYVNGVLTLNLPKKETVKEVAKEINIS